MMRVTMKDIIHQRPKWNGTDQVEFIMIRTTGGTEDLNATGMMVSKQLADDLADALEDALAFGTDTVQIRNEMEKILKNYKQSTGWSGQL